ncbi:hypothetical protein HBI56_023440 [Parastagonospora nodorum]|uniref:Uncharacterized protein n=1 Tax=Phaeosphaeria nodorum (strain SN15 / ATCC MYA-4574 / FGSC 10173) TaxID=321614 RepID=A0A7U2F516_PHANO|nr:hypothetical protein HBH56_025080 [Parastagonospora nodorum]QRC98846.1 hypothetical protein JI435_062090 [Parastagonospora nodorum SN15]KAH3934137.1 hypothetical protein HBH54_056920 [Parastagonospora nodorum]KAH3949880.1 hypothetical protein HBH53_084610 [Parastagonospora nodorum]KAH3975819.1 hypothetical protein HBH51_080730 [Parastagonospora nodorum]
MADEAQKNVVQLAEQVAEGFAALSGEYQILFDQQKQLESKLSWAKQQYLDLLKRFTPNTLSQDHLTFLQDLEHVGDEQPRIRLDLIEQLAQCDDVERKGRAVALRQAEIAAGSLRSHAGDPEVKIWSGPSADQATALPHINTNDRSPMEKDFTIAGTPSKLGCPFASTTSGRGSLLATPHSSTSRSSLRGRRSKRPSFTDPIRAEICGLGPPSASAEPSVAASGSAAVCPIRFLDQHDPEEVAKYFEKHKHELPRSHEVCITRFQSNQESIEQLDRKYGNLTNMIQGLGQKHQAWLPEEPEDAIEEEPEAQMVAGGKADAKVEKWAKTVSASLHEGTPSVEEEPIDHGADETRTAHFDRPMNEVRVGESPSRPWGITIPPKYTDAHSSSSVGSVPTASPPVPLKTDRPIGETPQKTGKCPFDHRAMGKTPEHKPTQPPSQLPQFTEPTTPRPRPPMASQPPPQPQRHEPRSPEPSKAIPQMVFNGPVFLGYPPDQLLALLQNSNLGASLR